MTFRAKYPGRCSDCGDDIEVGDLLDWNADETSAVHAECAAEPREVLTRSGHIRPREVCPRCFMELPVSGICGVCDPDETNCGVGATA